MTNYDFIVEAIASPKRDLYPLKGEAKRENGIVAYPGSVHVHLFCCVNALRGVEQTVFKALRGVEQTVFKALRGV